MKDSVLCAIPLDKLWGLGVFLFLLIKLTVMTKLEQTLLEINRHLKVEPNTPGDVLLYLEKRLTEVLSQVYNAEDDQEFFGYIEELQNLIVLIPRDFDFTYLNKKVLNDYIMSGMLWDNFMTEDGEKKSWKDETEEGDFMTLGSMFYNKLSWISEGSENEYLTDFADEFGEDLLIPFLNELEVVCK